MAIGLSPLETQTAVNSSCLSCEYSIRILLEVSDLEWNFGQYSNWKDLPWVAASSGTIFQQYVAAPVHCTPHQHQAITDSKNSSSATPLQGHEVPFPCGWDLHFHDTDDAVL